MENKIIEIISTVTKLEKSYIKENLNTQKLWESITHVEVVIALEEEFDISFSQDEIAQMTTVEKIIELINKKAQ